MLKNDAYLRQTLELLNILSEEKNVIVAALDPEFRYIYYNQSYFEEMQRLTGKAISIGMSMPDALASMPEQQKIAVEEWTPVFRGERTDKTVRFGDADLYQKVYRVKHIPIKDESGRVIGACEVANEISDQLQAEIALKESEKRYATLFNSMGEGFAVHEIICDESGKPVDYRFLDINPAFEKLTGLARAEVIGKTHNELLPDDSPLWVDQYGSVALNGVPKLFEHYSPTLQRYYEVFAYSLSKAQFAAIFSDITELKHEEEALNWLASFPENNPQVVAVVEFSGNITYMNPAGKKLFPDAQENMYQHPFLSGSEAIMERLRNGEPFPISREVAINDTWYKQTWVYLPDFNSVRIYSMDITDRIEAESALKQSNAKLEESVRIRTEELRRTNEELQQDIINRIKTENALIREKQRFNDVLEILPAYLIMLTPDHRVTFTNRYFRENLGEPRDLRCYEYLFGRSEPCENCESFRVMDTKAPHHWEWTGPNAHTYDVYDFPLTDNDGSSLILEMGIDITEVKKSQDELRNLNAYNRSLIEANLDTLVTITPDGKIGDVNAATEAVTGYSRDELIGTDFLNYFTDPQKALAGYQEVFKTGTVRDHELEIQHKDGHITPVAYNASVYFDETGNVAGVFAGARDLTELKRKENQLISLNAALEESIEQEQKLHTQLALAEKFAAMGRMLVSITHEINNPLQTIKNCLYLIESDIPADSQGHEFLDMASSETERISNLVAQLRDVYRPRQEGQLKPFSLSKALDEVHALLNPQLQNGHVQWVQSVMINDPLVAMIIGVEDQIKQVFINLGMNAIEAMQPSGGKLMVKIIEGKEKPEIGVIFQDSGPGIAPEHLARMFEPFFSTKSKGLGLGLSICYDIIQKHNGQITVKSEPGQGAIFEVWLPKVEA